MKVVVTGAEGQLGLQFKSVVKKSKNWKFLNYHELDITKIDKVLSYFSIFSPDVLINCAAYTNVDEAENDSEMAFEVNHKGVKNLLLACDYFNIRFIHFSTDYIYDGYKSSPYLETDLPNPINIYGCSKLAGEMEILKSNVKSIIIRTSWLYSNFGKNFVKNILNVPADDEYKIINDQIGSPTNAEDLVFSVIKILNNPEYEWVVGGDTFNFSNDGYCSWYEFAIEIANIAKLKDKILPVKTSYFKSLASRPKYCALNTNKFKDTFNINVDNWRDSLKRMLKKEIISI